MTQEEILQYNKRCAEFLGYEFDELSETYETPHLKLVEPQAFGDEQFSCKLKIYELDFHSDWNWIMEVKNHIIGLGYCWFQFPDTIQINENSTMSSKSICKVRFHKLQEKEAVVQAINQFLIWYEQNKTT